MSTTDTNAKTGEAHRAGAFDIRTFIALLLGIYGVILVITSFVSTSDAELDKADGLNINLWAGLGMIVVAALFQSWAMWRPIIVPDHPEDESPDQAPDEPSGPTLSK